MEGGPLSVAGNVSLVRFLPASNADRSAMSPTARKAANKVDPEKSTLAKQESCCGKKRLLK